MNLRVTYPDTSNRMIDYGLSSDQVLNASRTRYNLPSFEVRLDEWEANLAPSEETRQKRREAAKALHIWRKKDRITGAPAPYEDTLRSISLAGVGLMAILLLGLSYNLSQRNLPRDATAIPKGYLIIAPEEKSFSSAHVAEPTEREHASIVEEVGMRLSSQAEVINAIESRKP